MTKCHHSRQSITLPADKSRITTLGSRGRWEGMGGNWAAHGCCRLQKILSVTLLGRWAVCSGMHTDKWWETWGKRNGRTGWYGPGPRNKRPPDPVAGAAQALERWRQKGLAWAEVYDCCFRCMPSASCVCVHTSVVISWGYFYLKFNCTVVHVCESVSVGNLHHVIRSSQDTEYLHLCTWGGTPPPDSVRPTQPRSSVPEVSILMLLIERLSEWVN